MRLALDASHRKVAGNFEAGAASCALRRVRCPAQIAPTAKVGVPVDGAVRGLGPVLGALDLVAGRTEQLGFADFREQHIPWSFEVAADREGLGRGVYVIEDKAVRGTAAHALTAEHLKELSASSLLALLVLGHDVGHARVGHLIHRRDVDIKGLFATPLVAQRPYVYTPLRGD
jgi:hypothetical protein